MDEMTDVNAVSECCWKEEVTYGARVPEVLLAKDMKNWMSHMLSSVSCMEVVESGKEALQDVRQNQVPLRPYVGRSLNGLHTRLGRGIDLVQLLVRIIGHGGPRGAKLLIRMMF